MANIYDVVLDQLTEQLERLGRIDVTSEAGKAEMERAKELRCVAAGAVDAANSKRDTIMALHDITGQVVDMTSATRMLGIGDGQ